VAAAIRHSDFVVIAKTEGWDRNWDATGFEIVDGERRPFFQIEREENVIKLAGLFRLSDGTLLAINEHEMDFNPTTPIVSATPLFEYPSVNNLHVRRPNRAF
jgi:hypothetical protein